jgi:4-amino-4-deoxy-L-arabinose transferase-like glycosyltransferase
LSLRLAFVALEPEVQLVGDEVTWTTWGRELASPEVRFSPLASRILFYPPGYPYFVGCVLALFGSLAAVKTAQALLSALLIPAVGQLGARLFGGRAGGLAALLTAVYPDLVWFSAHFWAETLFLTLLYGGLASLLSADEGRRESALAAGMLFGLAALTREPGLYFVPIAVLFLARARRARRCAIALGLAALGTVAPWTVRNALVFHAFVPVSTFGPFNLWLGNTHQSRQEVYAEYARVSGRIAKYRHTQARAWEAIAARQPWWLLEKLRDEMPRFWEADSQALAHLRRGAYGAVAGRHLRLAEAVFVLPYLVALGLFALGLARAPSSPGVWLLLALVGYYVAIHVASHGFARFRLPVMPILLLFAAAAVSGPRLGASLRRRVLAWLVAAVLALSVLPSLGERLSGARALPDATADQAPSAE